MAVSEAAFRLLRDETPADAGFDAESESFAPFYRRYYPRLFALCKRRVGQDALAEDIAQETLLRALTHIDAFDPTRPPWPWLKTIATNLIVDHFRKELRETQLIPDRAGQTVENPPFEEADLLKRAIARLPRRQRAAVALRYLNDWDANDAARFMGLTKPAYDQLLFRARRRLRTEYHRLAEHVSAGVFAGSAWIRALSRRAATRLRCAAIENAPAGDLASMTLSQLATTTVALALALGGAGVPAQSTEPRVAAVLGRPVAATDARDGNDVRPSRPRGRDSHNLRGGSAPAGDRVIAAVEGERPGSHEESRSLVGQMTNEDVHQPEDARITSIALGSGFSEDGTGYASGRATCTSEACPAVLFKTTDGGRTWTRAPAEAFDSESLLLPPSHGPGDDRFFAMGRLGLQVTDDGGRTFTPAAPTGAAYVVGSAAISPAFDAGDPTILIGAQTLMRYRDDLGVVEPAPSTSGAGPLEPAFSPQYPSDPRIVIGGLHQNPEAGGRTAAVHTCSGSACSAAVLGPEALVPQVRLAPDFARSQRAYAFTDYGVYRSLDGARTFQQVEAGWEKGLLNDLLVAPDGRLVAAVEGADAGVYLSLDDGRTWTRVDGPLLQAGAESIAASGSTIMAALTDPGLACSLDGGVTWAPRCGP